MLSSSMSSVNNAFKINRWIISEPSACITNLGKFYPMLMWYTIFLLLGSALLIILTGCLSLIIVFPQLRYQFTSAMSPTGNIIFSTLAWEFQGCSLLYWIYLLAFEGDGVNLGIGGCLLLALPFLCLFSFTSFSVLNIGTSLSKNST